MNARSAVAVVGLLLCVHAGWAGAQADNHAEALTRATCQTGKQSEAVTSATALLEHDPDDLGPRLRLADALVDQGCYQEAVGVLEAGQQAHPHSSELAGKLRDVRSLVTEQTYIEGLTQAAEGAKFQRNQLRCTRLADLTACDEALKFKPDDLQLLLAKGDALVQSSRPADAVAAYRHAAQLKPGDEAVKSKLVAAEALQASALPAPTAEAQVAVPDTAAPAARTLKRASATTAVASTAPRRGPAAGSAAPGGLSTARTPAAAPPVAAVASLVPQNTRTYSNDAPPGQTN
jgi:cytochrome c-type biogenesis protein CcmH/NrfG